MSNSTQSTAKASVLLMNIIAYYALMLIIVGTLSNSLSFVILSRLKFRHIHERSIVHYMRAVVVFDILMLYGWNLDHYLLPIHGFDLNSYTIVSCKLVNFLNYFAPQTCAWLRVLICLDRYVLLSRLHRTWLGKSTTAHILIACVIAFFALFNIHLLIFACSHGPHGRIISNTRSYRIHPTWDFVNLSVYNCLPFLLMISLNTGVIYHLIRVRHLSTLQRSRIDHRKISVTSLVTTFLFLIMTIPGTVAYAFFINTAAYIVLIGLDSMLFTYHVSSLPLFLITFDEFRREFRKLWTCPTAPRRIPSKVVPSVVQSRRS